MSRSWILAGVAAVVMLGGCSSGYSEQDQAFLSRLGEPADSAQAGELATAGQAVCERLRGVADLDGLTAVQVSLRSDFPGPVDRFGILAFEDAATQAYCPDVAAGLQARVQSGLDAAMAESQEAARRADELLSSATPAPSLLAPPTGSAPDGSTSGSDGYVDPLGGVDEGREPTSGELQFRYGCEQGYIPPDQC